MKWNEYQLARAVALQVLDRKCLMLIDNCSWTGHECDVLGVTNDLRIIDVEIKISRADLKADAKKDKWFKRLSYAEAKARGVDMWEYKGDAREHPAKVWKHYYALPREIWKPDLLEALPSTASGIILFREQANGTLGMSVERRATPAKDATRITAEQAIDIARLASLRMWEAYKARDELVREKVAA